MTQFITVNNGWQYLTLQVNEGFIQENLQKYISQFWISVMSKLDSDQVVAVIIKIILSDGTYKTLGPVQKVTKKDMKELVDTLKLFLNLRANDYSGVEVNKIQIQSILINKNGETSIHKPMTNEMRTYKSGNYHLPLSTNISKWGTIIQHNGNVITLVNPKYPGVFIVITVHPDKQLYQFLINGNIKFEVEDYIGNNHESFTRIIRKIQTLHVQDGEVIFKSIINKVKFIKSEKPCNKINRNFITLDIETRESNGNLSPYCISLFDGKISWSFYLSDYNSIDDMMKSALSSLMKRKYNGVAGAKEYLCSQW